MTKADIRAAVSERHERFAQAYVNDPECMDNATKAARAAGYAWPDKQGSRILARPEVARRVEQLQDEAIAALEAEMEAWRRIEISRVQKNARRILEPMPIRRR